MLSARRYPSSADLRARTLIAITEIVLAGEGGNGTAHLQ